MQEYLGTKIAEQFDVNRYMIRVLLAQMKLATSLIPNFDADALQIEVNRFFSFKN